MSIWASQQQKLKQFFFSEEVPFGFALMRITLSLVLLQGVWARWPHCIDLYSSEGTPFSLIDNYGYHAWNFLPPMPPFWAACCMTLLVLFLISSCVGFCTRISLLGALFFHTYFAINDLTSSITKFSVISAHALLLLALSECGRVWSVDSWLASQRDRTRIWDSDRPAWALAPIWPQRLLLILIGAVYLGAAIQKLHMPEFLTGQAMGYWIMSNPNFRHFIGEWLSQSPSFLIASAHFTVLWEVTFFALAWRGIPRYLVFGLGFFFHMMSALTLGEVIFFMIMSTTYLGCMNDREFLFVKRMLAAMLSPLVRRMPLAQVTTFELGRWLPAKLTSASPRVHLANFCALLTICGLAGAWSNVRMDYYGQNRAEGKYTLQEMPIEEASWLLKPFEPVREVDKFLGVDVGSLVIAGRLADRCNEFRHGDVLICETSFNPPLDDMYVECNLVSDDQKVINRVGNIVAREHMFAQFKYILTDALEPGNYFLVVKSRGKEICRREFRIKDGLQAPVAN